MTLFQPAPTSAPDPKSEPYVPSHALVLVQFGVPHLLYHQGNDLNYFVEGCGSAETAACLVSQPRRVNHMSNPLGVSEPPLSGVFVWSGQIRGWKDYFGECDEELVTESFRPVLAEEWRAFVAGEFLWDIDLMQAWVEWGQS